MAQSPRETGTISPRGGAPHHLLWHWLDRNIFELGREMRLSYLPPLMVYAAAGISGLTGIVGRGALGPEDAVGSSRGPDLALQGRDGIPGRRYDCL